MRKNIKQKIIILIFMSTFILPSLAFSAQLFLETENSKVMKGDEFEVGFFVNTNEDINAIEARIFYPDNIFKLKEIKDGNSVINFWVERPREENQEIIFSGIIPGGYLDKKGLIFSLIFEVINEGQGSIGIKNERVLLNDGLGTETQTLISELEIISSGESLNPKNISGKIIDNNPPEKFEAIISTDPSMFNGKYFLIFNTQDKGSGIDHYEIKEGTKKFKTAASPYLLRNQNLTEEIVIKAIDKNGNERLSIIYPQNEPIWYQNYWIFIIIGLVLFIIILNKKLWQKFTKSH